MPDVPGPSSALLETIDLVTFDCFGTLVDWEKALPALGVEMDRMPVFLAESERAQRPQRRDAPFVEYRGLLEHVGSVLRPDLPTETVQRWARAFGELPFFSDTMASMALLGRVVDVGVISNCDAVHQLDVTRRLGRPWDVCIVAEELEAYKPTDRAWDRAVQLVEHRGYDRARWLHVSAWDDYDLAPAGARGIRTGYVARPGGLAPRAGSVDASFTDLLHLARAIADAKQGPVVYEVVGRGEPAVMDRFVRWMIDEHLAEVRACKGVRGAELVRIDDGSVQCIYRFTGRAAYSRYLDKDAPRLRARGRELFTETELAFERSAGTIRHAL
jgi:2-haloacid dehalogenase